mmetsp:Transcript_14534/g.43918  ORF Transcript_14534/g.43918 Transcript_14534/m.43918 type:complete len:205 (+) Transcript_14534:1987-2601(+)
MSLMGGASTTCLFSSCTFCLFACFFANSSATACCFSNSSATASLFTHTKASFRWGRKCPSLPRAVRNARMAAFSAMAFLAWTAVNFPIFGRGRLPCRRPRLRPRTLPFCSLPPLLRSSFAPAPRGNLKVHLKPFSVCVSTVVQRSDARLKDFLELFNSSRPPSFSQASSKSLGLCALQKTSSPLAFLFPLFLDPFFSFSLRMAS